MFFLTLITLLFSCFTFAKEIEFKRKCLNLQWGFGTHSDLCQVTINGKDLCFYNEKQGGLNTSIPVSCKEFEAELAKAKVQIP